MRAVQIRREAPFGRFVARYGVRRLVADVRKVTIPGLPNGAHITTHSVYDWLSGRRTPDWRHAKAVVAISGGELTVFDVMDHRLRLASLSAQRGLPMDPLPEPRGPQHSR